MSIYTYYTDDCLVNYDKVIKFGHEHNPVTKYVDDVGRLHRTDGPAFINLVSSKMYLHGEEIPTIEEYNKKIIELGLKKKFLDLME